MFQGSIIASLLGLTSTLLWAQADQQVLQEVVVSGSRTETKLSETPVSIGAVSRDKWDADKPKNVGEIINRIPGVFWNDLGNEQHSMGIRQPISTNSVYQYLEDGIPIRPLTDEHHADSASSSFKSGTYTPNTQNSYSPGAPRSVMVGLTWSMK